MVRAWLEAGWMVAVPALVKLMPLELDIFKVSLPEEPLAYIPIPTVGAAGRLDSPRTKIELPAAVLKVGEPTRNICLSPPSTLSTLAATLMVVALPPRVKVPDVDLSIVLPYTLPVVRIVPDPALTAVPVSEPDATKLPLSSRVNLLRLELFWNM